MNIFQLASVVDLTTWGRPYAESLTISTKNFSILVNLLRTLAFVFTSFYLKSKLYTTLLFYFLKCIFLTYLLFYLLKCIILTYLATLI
jgi:hypothetical protein